MGNCTPGRTFDDAVDNSRQSPDAARQARHLGRFEVREDGTLVGVEGERSLKDGERPKVVTFKETDKAATKLESVIRGIITRRRSQALIPRSVVVDSPVALLLLACAILMDLAESPLFPHNVPTVLRHHVQTGICLLLGITMAWPALQRCLQATYFSLTKYCAVVLACLVLFLNGFVTQMPAVGRVVPCVTIAFLVAVSLERLKMPWGFTTWYPAIAAACAISFILTFLYEWLEVLCAVFEEPEAPVVEEQRGHGELLKAALTSFGGGLFLWFYRLPLAIFGAKVAKIVKFLDQLSSVSRAGTGVVSVAAAPVRVVSAPLRLLGAPRNIAATAAIAVLPRLAAVLPGPLAAVAAAPMRLLGRAARPFGRLLVGGVRGVPVTVKVGGVPLKVKL
mmetsp:Transcript_33484/g.103723  ORF Transcript_33484/g.103723 Transcript_33484/m.103723 type:complete len:393 (+) Transcript_33484:1250-2428(+)